MFSLEQFISFKGRSNFGRALSFRKATRHSKKLPPFVKNGHVCKSPDASTLKVGSFSSECIILLPIYFINCKKALFTRK